MAIRAKRKDTRPEEFLHGVPNADISDEDFQALSVEDRQRVRDSDLYTVRTEHESASHKSSEKAAESAPDRKAG